LLVRCHTPLHVSGKLLLCGWRLRRLLLLLSWCWRLRLGGWRRWQQLRLLLSCCWRLLLCGWLLLLLLQLLLLRAPFCGPRLLLLLLLLLLLHPLLHTGQPLLCLVVRHHGDELRGHAHPKGAEPQHLDQQLKRLHVGGLELTQDVAAPLHHAVQLAAGAEHYRAQLISQRRHVLPEAYRVAAAAAAAAAVPRLLLLLRLLC
jgi:hypothetical protein